VFFHHVDGLQNIGLWIRLDLDLLCNAVLVMYESVQARFNLTRDLALLETDDYHSDRAHAEVRDNFRFEHKSATSSPDNYCSGSGAYRPKTWQ
jgi:hypothetical protein